jgi:hypothetical protein
LWRFNLKIFFSYSISKKIKIFHIIGFQNRRNGPSNPIKRRKYHARLLIARSQRPRPDG